MEFVYTDMIYALCKANLCQVLLDYNILNPRVKYSKWSTSVRLICNLTFCVSVTMQPGVRAMGFITLAMREAYFLPVL